MKEANEVLFLSIFFELKGKSSFSGGLLKSSEIEWIKLKDSVSLKKLRSSSSSSFEDSDSKLKSKWWINLKLGKKLTFISEVKSFEGKIL